MRGARLLLDILDGKCRPAMAMAKVPLIVSAIHGGTEGEGPFADVMRLAKSHEGRDDILSTSVFLVHPYLDLPGLGGGGLVIADGDVEKAKTLAGEIAMMYWSRRFDLEPQFFSPSEAISRGLQIDGGPVLLVETADCCGGGAAGDSVATLRALLESNISQPSLVPVVDPEAAAECHRLGLGREATLELGHKIDPKWGRPISVRGTITKLSGGRFVYGAGGVWENQETSMGPTAVLSMDAVQVLIMTIQHSDWHVYSNMEHINRHLESVGQPHGKGAYPRTDSILALAMNISIGVVDGGLGAGFGLFINSDDDEIARWLPPMPAKVNG